MKNAGKMPDWEYMENKILSTFDAGRASGIEEGAKVLNAVADLIENAEWGDLAGEPGHQERQVIVRDEDMEKLNQLRLALTPSSSKDN